MTDKTKLTKEEMCTLDKISKKGITIIINANLPNVKDLDLIPDIYLRNTIYGYEIADESWQNVIMRYNIVVFVIIAAC